MGRLKSNVLAQPHGHRPPRDSLDLDARLSGSLAAFKFAISAGFEKIRSDSFRKAFAPRSILLFQKMRGWLRFYAGKRTNRVAPFCRTVDVKTFARRFLDKGFGYGHGLHRFEKLFSQAD
jgi:hypothetical protein